MKLDSEDQRAKLLELLGGITIQTTLAEAGSVESNVNAILDPIRNAEIEGAAKPRRRKAGK